MNIQRWRQFDFSLGVQDATIWPLKKPNELARGINLRFTEKVGGFERRPGFVKAGSQFSTVPNAPQGGHIAKFSNGSRRFVAVNNDAGSATIIRYQNSGTGAWTTLSGIPTYPVDSILFFKDYLDEVYVSGFDSLSGDPIQPININKDLNVSTTRNLTGAPRGYFFEEYLGLLYLANVLVDGVRHKDRVYKSSPPLGAMTFVQGAQSDPLTAATLLDNVPPMTSNTAPSGVAAASSQYDATWQPYQAFNGSLVRAGGNWFTASTVVTGWISYDFGSGNAKAITHYSIVGVATDAPSGDLTTAAKNWTFEGSNDGSSWTVLHTVTNAPSWINGEKRYYTTTNTTAYRYYRVNITANQGSTAYTGLNELELLTSVQGTRSIELKVDSVRYIKQGMALDIYKAGTETKLFDVAVTAVDKEKNTIIFAPYMESFATGAVSAANDTITLTSTTALPTGTPIKFDTTSATPGGLTADVVYYAIWVDATTIKVASSLENARLGIAIDLTSTGTGTHRLRLSYTLADNDEIWLDGTKGKLNIFWNTDYPNPQATGEFLHIKPGTAANPQITGIGASSNRLFIFTKNSGTRWDGQNLVTFNRSVGCISHRSIGNIDDDWLLWVDAKGNIRARSENAGAQENISRAIRNPWMRKLTQDQLKAVSLGVVGQVAKFYLGEIDDNYMRVCYDFEANTWSPERLGYPAVIQAEDDYTGDLKPYFFSTNGRVYMDEEGNLDDDKVIAFEAGTGRDMFGTEQVKKFDGIRLFSRNCNGLRLQAAVDGGQMKTIGRIEGTVCYMKFPEQGDNILPRGVSIDWQIVGAVKGDPPEVEGAVVYWVPEENIPNGRTK